MVTIRLQRPHAGQAKVINEAKRFNVLQCGRRFGKSALGRHQICQDMLNGIPAAWFAPSYKILTEIWRELCAVLQPITDRLSQQEKRIECVTGGVLECWSLDQPDAGRSRKYGDVVIDEAGLVRELESAWNEAIRPTLADLKGGAWFLGTPKGHNFFQRLYARGQEGNGEWASWRMPTVANPFIDPVEIEAARRDMPESAYNQEFLGIPADDGGNPFGLDSIARQSVGELSAGDPAFVGCDLAKSQDFTVVCGLDSDGRVCLLERWQSDWDQTTRRVIAMIGDKQALIDSTGVGDPIVENICRECPSARGFKFTSSSKQQLMEGLSAAIQQREVFFPDGWLRNELESFEYEYTQSGVRYGAPSGMHDDGVCALALAVRQMKTPAVEFDSGFYTLSASN